ncbi:MAG: hypothetical protein LCH81_08955 [Bacteroidetes bacterium]|nr:hypothetical protein [Bacteroidota bacterium]
MKRAMWVLAVLATFQIWACKNQNQAQNTAQQTEQTKSEPDNNDLLETLQGKWQNTADPAYSLEIVDTKMRHFNGGKLAGETDIEVDGFCSNVSCQGAAAEDGWCFLEKGQFDIQCHLVAKCTPDTLRFSDVGTESGMQSFKKIR